MAKKKKRRTPLGLLLGGVLSLIDWLCEGIASACMALLRVLAWLARALLIGAWRLFLLLLRGLCAPFAWLWRRLTGKYLHAGLCARLTGEEFEGYMALVLADNHFRHVEKTRGSGDQGVDLLAERNGKTYAIQCKNYAGAVGNFAVQEAYAGAQHYGCDVAVVVCPGTFTRGAKELADSTGVVLWGEDKLTRMMQRSGRKPRRSRN